MYLSPYTVLFAEYFDAYFSYSMSQKGGKNIEELHLCEGYQTLDFNALIN